MKKYKVTDKHLLLKKDVRFDVGALELNPIGILDKFGGVNVDTRTINDWLESGWIEEIQEPEFTRKDMIDFLKYAEDNAFNLNYEDLLDKWIYSINESAK